MKGNGKMICKMGGELKVGMMVVSMRVNIKKV